MSLGGGNSKQIDASQIGGEVVTVAIDATNNTTTHTLSQIKALLNEGVDVRCEFVEGMDGAPKAHTQGSFYYQEYNGVISNLSAIGISGVTISGVAKLKVMGATILDSTSTTVTSRYITFD